MSRVNISMQRYAGIGSKGYGLARCRLVGIAAQMCMRDELIKLQRELVLVRKGPPIIG
jgi:hypothetical protein